MFHHAEIIAVGSELLLGNVANTDAQYVSQKLAAVGVDVLYHTVVGDNPERLRQVFSNLLDNAAKHGGSGKRIAVHLSQQEGEYVITIRDFGPGIPEAELPYVKQKFYKGSSKARGSGIGLAVCDEIVQRHGGRLDIANAEGGGAVVTISLPMS